MQEKALKKWVKIPFVLSVTFVLMLTLFGDRPLQAEAIDITNMPQVVLACSEDAPPFEYRDKDGVYRGFDVDLLTAISWAEGFDLVLKPMPYSQAMEALKQGQVDGVLGLDENASNKSLFDFSSSYLTMSQAIFVSQNNHFILHLADLAGARVAVQKGDIANELQSQVHPSAMFISTSQEEAFNWLLNGKADAVVANELTGFYYIQQIHKEKDLKIVGDPLLTTPYGVALAKGNEVFLTKINSGLAELRHDGTYDKIYARWFGRSLVNPTIPSEVLTVIVSGFIALALAVIAFLVWNRSLAKMVHIRTVDLAQMNNRLAQLNSEIIRANDFKEVVLDSVFSGIITLSLTGSILSINRSALRILGMELEECLEESVFDVPPFGELMNQEVLTDNGTPFNREETVEMRGGQRRLKINVSPFEPGDLLRSGFILVIADITDEWSMRQHLQHQDKLEALGQIAAGIAHEIRNPLTSIKGFIQLLPTKFQDEHFRQTLVSCLPDEVNRLEGIVNEMLDLTRRKIVDRQEWILKDMVERVVTLVEKAPESRQVLFQIDIPEDLTICADVQQMRQVFLNLLLNAVAAVASSRSQGEVRQGIVRIQAEETSPGRVLVEIEDNGAGIAEEIMKKVFDPFFTTKPNGTGLGLATVHQYIVENNGEIQLHSYPGMGTTVSVTLPRRDVLNPS